MNDEEIEKLLRGLPQTELPTTWRDRILREAVGESAARKPNRGFWPSPILWVARAIRSNPATTSALAVMWLLILVLRWTTPFDSAERDRIARTDSTKPVYLVSLVDEIRLVDAGQRPAVPQPVLVP